LNIRRSAPVVLALASIATGCTKTAPATISDFGADKTMVVRLRDGETLEGKINEGESVTFTTFGKVYRAKVETFDENGNITLFRPYVQEEYDDVSVQRERLRSSPLRVEDGTERITIPAYRIASVEEVGLDRMRTARAAGFWAFAVAVLAGVMSARL
jgi:small nuclear ribonucleoprotein (snRNP)-like protein